MFTGLARELGIIRNAARFGEGKRFRIDIGCMAGTVTVGQSVAVNGACLTATTAAGNEATFDAVAETVSRTNLGFLRVGDKVNLEPALKAGDALDGHLMLGHVDALGEVLEIDSANPDNRVVRIGLPAAIRHLVAEKGSVAVDGISLTVAKAGNDWFTIAVIPHSWENSTLSKRGVGDKVNLEADVLARYAARVMQFGFPEADGGITENFLRDNGFA